MNTRNGRKKRRVEWSRKIEQHCESIYAIFLFNSIWVVVCNWLNKSNSSFPFFPLTVLVLCVCVCSSDGLCGYPLRFSLLPFISIFTALKHWACIMQTNYTYTANPLWKHKIQRIISSLSRARTVHVELDQSTQSSTDLATNQQYGCSIDDEFYAEGAQVNSINR